jgi:flagellar FliL protein
MGDAEEPIEDIESTAEEEEQIEAGGPKRRLFGPSMVRVLLYVAAALVMIVISGTVAFLVAKRSGVQPGGGRISPEQVQKVKPYIPFDLGEFSINTSDPVEPHFIKVTIVLGYEELKAELQTELNARRAQLRDTVIRTVGGKTYDELNTEDKRAALKKELLGSINDILINGTIKEVYFTEFVLT